MSSLSFNKTRLGFDPFDRAFGGIFFNRPTLVWGPRGSGKSLLSAQFSAKVLQTGERVCVMSDANPDDFFLDLQSLHVDVGSVLASGQLRTFSCRAIAAASPDGLLPFDEAVEELRGLCAGNNTPFFVFNTVVPWLAVAPDNVEARIEAFVSAIEELGITALLLLPRPASPAANKLRDTLAERCPIVLQTLAKGDSDRHIRVARYRGASDVTLPADYAVGIAPGRGFVALDETGKDASSRTPEPLPSSSAARTRRRHQALIPASGANPVAAPVPGAVAHPHRNARHHSLLDPTAITAADAASKPPARTPAPAPAPARAQAPVPETAPAPAPAPAPAKTATRRRFSALAPAGSPAQPTAAPAQAPAPAPAPASAPTPPSSPSPATSPSRHRFSTVIR